MTPKSAVWRTCPEVSNLSLVLSLSCQGGGFNIPTPSGTMAENAALCCFQNFYLQLLPHLADFQYELRDPKCDQLCERKPVIWLPVEQLLCVNSWKPSFWTVKTPSTKAPASYCLHSDVFNITSNSKMFCVYTKSTVEPSPSPFITPLWETSAAKDSL